jgi:thymidylate kinase
MRGMGPTTAALERRKGLFVLIVGPDGAGKTSLAARLVGVARDSVGVQRMHWRPELLPRLGALVGRSPRHPSTPHADPSRSPLFSAPALAYYWVDFFLGSWLRIRPSVRRGELVVMERGWFDFAVDPRRYRLSVSPAVVRLLGRLLPRPDLVLVLDASEETLLSRKTELPGSELTRQMRLWRDFGFPSGTMKVLIDAGRPLEEVVQEARETVDNLMRIPIAADQPSWASLPTKGSARWFLPSSSNAAARSSLLVYHPITVRARIGWELGRVMAVRGALRLVPQAAPPEAVSEVVAPIVPPGGTVAVARANRPARYVVLVLDECGAPHAFAKVALDEEGSLALRRELDAVQQLAQLLSPPIFAPKVLRASEGMVVFEAVGWRPRAAPWRLPEQVAYALGRVFAATMTGSDSQGAGHGDLAPWNLLRSEAGWALIDWEEARFDLPPFFDVFHFVVQANIDLHRPSKPAILHGLDLEGWVGGAIRGYAAGADIDPNRARACFSEYLRVSSEALDPFVPDHRAGLRARRRLAAMMSR